MSGGAAISIRDATPRDAAALGRLGALLVSVHHSFDPQRFMAPGPQTAEGYGRYLASELARPEAIVLVAEAEGDVIGYAYAGVEGADWMALRGPAGVIYDLVVDPGRRGAGLGMRLLEQVIQTLEVRGAPRVVLSTATRNDAAQRLFARAGFRPTLLEMTREARGPA